MKKWIQTLLTLCLIVAVSVVIIRLITGSETLSDYANKNPELAYGTAASTEATIPDETSLDEDTTDSNNTVINEDTTIFEETIISENTIIPEGNASYETAASSSKTDSLPSSSDAVIYQEGFFFEPLPDEIITRISGISYPVSATVASTLEHAAPNTVADTLSISVDLKELCYVGVLYYDFKGSVQTGELICNKDIAQDLVEIFYELYCNEYPIESIKLVDDFNGDDEASMEANNTSCFNYRAVSGSNNLSNHALGLAIDINPFYNPYVVKGKDGSIKITPVGSEDYAERNTDFPHKIDEKDLCYQLFTEHGFFWGGNWETHTDYQHFQKVS